MKTNIALMINKIWGLAFLFFLVFAVNNSAVYSGESDHNNYARALKYVDSRGMVDYQGLAADPANLELFIAGLAPLHRKSFNNWSSLERLVFWINTYNALTLKVILDHYPIKSSFARSLIYPDNSIRQIPDVWDDLKFRVMGEEMSLNQIEHKILRKDYHEPRIHLALVCAAMSCPALRNEPYTATKVYEQLADQARKFFSNKKNFRIDREEETVYISSIFKWYGEDFIRKYGADEDFAGKSETERAVLNYATGFLGQADREYLRKGEYDVEYLDYDWSLNEQ
jgi:Protein of unknown function, DUF547